MADVTYLLEKVWIGGSYYKLRVSVDASDFPVLYGDKNESLMAALEEIHTGITNLKQAMGNTELLLKTI